MDEPSMLEAEELALVLMRLYENGSVDSFDVVYTHFYSPVRLTPSCVRLFPVKPAVFGTPPEIRGEMVFEPGQDEVLETLIWKYIKGFIYDEFDGEYLPR